MNKEFDLQELKDQGEVCQVCEKPLGIGDTVRPFGIGGGFMYWCEDCDSKEEPIEEKKVLIIGKPISKMNESEVNEVLNELFSMGVIEKDENGHFFKPKDYENGTLKGMFD